MFKDYLLNFCVSLRLLSLISDGCFVGASCLVGCNLNKVEMEFFSMALFLVTEVLQ